MASTIRTAAAKDLPEILALWRDADAEPTHTDDLDSLTKLVRHDPDALIVAEVDGDIAGSVIAAWDGWRGSVYRLVVARAQRRQGLGKRLLGEAERRLAGVGAVRSHAIVVESDGRAASFWRASCWEQQVERLRFVKG